MSFTERKTIECTGEGCVLCEMAELAIQPQCQGCKKKPSEIEEYSAMLEGGEMTPDEFVRQEESTYNKVNGHFLCTTCYIAAGMPSAPGGWVCS